MTVSELIEILRQLPLDLPVWIEDRDEPNEVDLPQGGIEFLIKDADLYPGGRPRRVEL